MQLPRPWTVVRWIVTAAMAIGFSFAVRHLWDAARQHGTEQSARKALDAVRKRAALTSTTLRPPVVSTTSPVSDGEQTTTTIGAPSGPAGVVQPARIDASATASPAQDSCGATVSYEPAKMADGVLGTAWRVPGDGHGVTVTITLTKATHLTEIGLVPGYAKRDQCTDVDRFSQVRRIVQVAWHFDAGAPVTETFKDAAEMQSMPIDVRATTVTIEILTTTDAPVLDYTAISEIRLVSPDA